MFIMTTKVTKAKLIAMSLIFGVLLCTLIFALAYIEKGTSSEIPSTENILTNEDRVLFLSQWGWEVDSSAVETLDLLLPETLDESYQSYNSLQAEHFLDMTPYCGKRIKRYTYTVLNHPDHSGPVQANLYLYDTTIIAGDIMAPGENGFISSFHFPK